MDWTMIGAIGEIGGAVAVVASLLYVARQMKHATSVAAVEGFEAHAAKIADFGMAIAQDERLSDLIIQVQFEGRRRDDMSREERGRIGYTFFSLLVMNSSLFHRWRHGLLTDQEFERNSLQAAGLLAAPYLKDVWPVMATSFAPEYRAWVERRFDLGSALPEEGTT